MPLGPKGSPAFREPRPDLGKTLDPNEDRPNADEPQKVDLGDGTQTPDDPLARVGTAGAFVNRFRLEGSEMSVKMLFGQGIAADSQVAPISSLVMTIGDFQRLAHAASQLIANYRVHAKKEEVNASEEG